MFRGAIFDVLVALLIVEISATLAVTSNGLYWLLATLAVVWLVVSDRRRDRRRDRKARQRELRRLAEDRRPVSCTDGRAR